MGNLFFDWLSGLEHDKELRGANPEAVKQFSAKIKNLIRDGHEVERPEFYWTNGSQDKVGRGPYLRAIMKIDGKVNRFWFYDSCGFGRSHWQNTTKEMKAKRI